MNAPIKKIGNSKGVIIPSAVYKMLNLNEVESLALKVSGNDIILSKPEVFNPKSLTELFEGFKGTYDEPMVFDDAKGREIW